MSAATIAKSHASGGRVAIKRGVGVRPSSPIPRTGRRVLSSMSPDGVGLGEAVDRGGELLTTIIG